ncbi:MAG TPA: serine hydrolase domain-containing protein [Pyrinomonadaceae bacterium]|nr:serine hydrolase domain-containing protein [Pyrinomonadaceae bacterium]
MVKTVTILARILIALTLLTNASGSLSQTPRDKQRLDRFEKQVEDLRTIVKVPGMSAVIIKDQKVIWAKGFGFADLERKIPATPDTLYHLASITKTFGATLIMQLVEQGKLSLDEPASRYSSNFKDESVKIKHLITHTAVATPGEHFWYDGNNFDYLDNVIEKKTGKQFTQLAVETFFDPAGMMNSVPYHNVVVDADKWMASLGKKRLDRYKKNLEMFAQPYTYYGAGEMVHVSYPGRHYNGSAASLLSTVRDMAKYDIAIDRHMFLKKETQEKAWTPFISNAGKRLPYGLGWFVMNHGGVKLVWHTGHWGTGFSAFYLKVPEKNLSIIMLGNSESLIDHQYKIGEVMVDDMINNVFACAFLGTWKLAYGCEKNSQAAVTKWLAQRKASGRVAVRVDPKILETYVGEYQFETLDNRIYTVTREADRLFFAGPSGIKLEMFGESESLFFSKVRPYVLIFTKAEGQPAQVKIVEGDKTYLSKRLK